MLLPSGSKGVNGLNGDNKIIYQYIGELHGKVDGIISTQKKHEDKLDEIIPSMSVLKTKMENVEKNFKSNKKGTEYRIGRLEKGAIILLILLLASGAVNSGVIAALL